ncbi:hypothetical protein GBA52_012102 [Prunus armeniaca]|nr:hypothetical protein GBA52_012102 [Prunus armeniaca]
MARQFNRALKQKVFQLRKELLLAAITHVNVFAAKYKLLSNAKKHGFLDKTRICCGYHEDSNHVKLMSTKSNEQTIEKAK